MKSRVPSVLLLSIAGLGQAIACSNEAAQESRGDVSAEDGAAPGSSSGTTPGSSQPGPIPEGTVSPDTGAPGTGTPGTGAPGTGAPGTETPGTETPGTDAPDSETPGSEAPAEPTGSAEPSTDSPETAPPEETSTEEDAAPGSDAPPAPLADVSFSVPSGTFEGSLSVSMTASSASAEIRYTTDGLLPTESSTLYDGAPLTVMETTQLRAQAFEAGVAEGSPVTAIYIRRTFDVTSDIPLIIMEAYGGGKPPTEAGPEKVVFRDLAFMLFEPVDGVAAISAPPTWASRSGYHVRGQSSAQFEKTPYRVELWDEYDEDRDLPMIGMPADSDWAMVGPYTDKTLIRNGLAYSLAAAMDMAAPELRFAEVYINQDTGPLEATDYEGVYAVTETIKNMPGRLDLKQLRPDDTSEADLSGGYIFKFDMGALREDEGEIEIPCTGLEELCFDDLELTDPVEPNAEQLAWIQLYIQEAHDLLTADPIGDYQAYLDFASFVDIVVLNELTKGGDKYVRSVYLHKDRDGLIVAGPAWDYNFTLGNYVSDVEGWQVDGGRDAGANWFRILFAQPEFRAALAARWAELRQGIFSDAELEARVDQVAAPLLMAGPRDLERWPVGEVSLFGGGGGFGGGAEDENAEAEDEAPTTWEGQLDDMKQWIRDRTAWLDAAYAEF